MSNSHWTEMPLEHIVDAFVDFRGRTPKKLSMNWGGGDIPALSANNVQMGKINLEKGTQYGDEVLYRRWMTSGDCAKGDIVITMEAPLGNVAQIPDNQRYILSQRVILLKTKKEVVDNDFLLHRLTWDNFQASLKEHATGTTAQGIQRAKFQKIPLTLPSVSEQKRIAAVLSRMDRAIEQTEAIIAKQQHIKTGLMQDLLTKGVDDNGNIRSEGANEFKDSELGKIPKEWDVVNLGSISNLVTSGPRGWAKYYSREGAPFLRIGNLTREHINLRLDNLIYVKPPQTSEGMRTALEQDDVLISITADLGIIGVIPPDFGEAFVNQHIALVRLDKKKILPRWVGHYLSSYAGQSQFQKLNESGAKAGLNLPTINKLLVAQPKDKDEQQFISDAIDHCVGSINAETTTLAKYQRLKRGLMQDLLSGEVSVERLLA